ncbi:MAG: type II secretion system protein M [Chromatiaceae bacterium]|nr:type II secretion system protein M [Chromatiaceae bacterium]
MKRFWRNLQARERMSLIIGALTVAGFLFYTLFWAPINEERSRLRASVAEQRELLAWMQTAADEVGRLRSESAKAMGGAGKSLLSRLDAVSKKMGLTNFIKRMQPDGDTNVRIWFEAVGFDTVLAWVREVSGAGDVVVRDFVVDKADAAGTVNVRLVLQGNAS